MKTPFLIVPPSGSTTSHAFRLHPQAPLKQSLCECADIIFARLPSNTSSLFVVTVVGSLRSVKLRLANASKIPMGDGVDGDVTGVKSSMGGMNEIREWTNERFEIVSLVGTFSRDGSCHLHLSISDANGVTYGGHLMEAEIFTTAEVVLGSADGVDFSREYDPQTGYKEFVPQQLIFQESWTKELQGLCKYTVAILIGFLLGLSFTERRKSK